MKVGFHLSALDNRGVPIAVFGYAKGNRDILNNESYIFYPEGSDEFSKNKFIDEFGLDHIIKYERKDGLQNASNALKLDVMYFIKYGYDDNMNLDGIKNVIHTVFRVNESHGNIYAYVSKWLSDEMSGGKLPYVPHIIDLPIVELDYRDFLKIPKDTIVFGRYGGYDEFNIGYVYDVIIKVAKENPNIYFLFMNTKKFCDDIPNIIHLEPTYEMEEKSAFINTCDAMLHARERGESFGLAIGEFLFNNKPVIACSAGEDKNHLRLLKDKGIYYTNQNELYQHLMTFRKHTGDERYKDLVRKYNPKDTMKKFKEVFLS